MNFNKYGNFTKAHKPIPRYPDKRTMNLSKRKYEIIQEGKYEKEIRAEFLVESC